VKWYRLSAAQALGTATMNLGYCSLRGHGVPADKTEALRLFRLAVEQGEETGVTLASGASAESLEGTASRRES
jgi:TPR repeat protein